MLQNLLFNRVEQRLQQESWPVNFEFWNGKLLELSDSSRITIRVRSPKALASLAKPTLGKLAQNYIEQHIDLVGDIREIIKLGDALCNTSGRIVQKGGLRLGWRRHTRSTSRDAISFHYDVSNDFYKLWLDSNLRIFSPPRRQP